MYNELHSIRSNIFPIVCDRDNSAIASNLKPIGTVIEKKSVSSVYYFELFAYFSETVLILSYVNPKLYCFVRWVSVECSETVVMNLQIIWNTFVNIRINSHTLHFHHSDWFQIVRDCRFYLYREQSERYLVKWDQAPVSRNILSRFL